jgi:hypothetical protein
VQYFVEQQDYIGNKGYVNGKSTANYGS